MQCPHWALLHFVPSNNFNLIHSRWAIVRQQRAGQVFPKDTLPAGWLGALSRSALDTRWCGGLRPRQKGHLLKVGRGLGSADSASSGSIDRAALMRGFLKPFLPSAPPDLLPPPVSAARASYASAAASAAAAAAAACSPAPYRPQLGCPACTEYTTTSGARSSRKNF
jgi:hypothetical protein